MDYEEVIKMAYDICNKCQEFFKKNGNQYCEKCDSGLNSSRNIIKEYIELNPGASIMEIVKETGVKLRDVNIFLESGGAAITFDKEPVNLRHEEIKKENEVMKKRESLKIKNKFSSRRLER